MSQTANATGSVGLIIGLRGVGSLRAVSWNDCGSRIENGRRITDQRPPLSMCEVEASLDDRISYNEWVVRDFEVLGIFAMPPFLVWREQGVAVPEDYPDYAATTALGPAHVDPNELREIFPDAQIYTFVGQALCELGGAPASNSHFYP